MLTLGGKQTALTAIFKNKMKSNYVPLQQFTQQNLGSKKGEYIPFTPSASLGWGLSSRPEHCLFPPGPEPRDRCALWFLGAHQLSPGGSESPQVQPMSSRDKGESLCVSQAWHILWRVQPNQTSRGLRVLICSQKSLKWQPGGRAGCPNHAALLTQPDAPHSSN